MTNEVLDEVLTGKLHQVERSLYVTRGLAVTTFIVGAIYLGFFGSTLIRNGMAFYYFFTFFLWVVISLVYIVIIRKLMRERYLIRDALKTVKVLNL